MTDEQKEAILRLRNLGYGYRVIAHQLNMSVDTIKSHCRRHDIKTAKRYEEYKDCLFCGAPLTQVPKKKRKKFCCNACRLSWWANQPESMRNLTSYTHTCELCGAEFQSHRKEQRFCSRKCAAASKRGETIANGSTEKNRYAASDCEAGQAWSFTKMEWPYSGPDTLRTGFPNLPPCCKCPECEWFIDGKKHCSCNHDSAETVSANDCKSCLPEEQE